MPLGDAHVLEDGSELGLVHGVEMDIRSAVASVLPVKSITGQVNQMSRLIWAAR